jgi:hypothetical protein
MHICPPEVTDHPRPVLMAHADPQLVTVLRDALDGLRPRHTLMVIPQLAVLRQYLTDSLCAGRSPAAIVLNMSDPGTEALVEWLRAQRSAIAAIPLVDIGTGPKPHPSQIDAAVRSPTIATLLDALQRVMKKPPHTSGP